MNELILDRAEFRDKVHACWMGKNIGGTLGEKWEGFRHTHALTFYDPVPDKASPNDDLDLQLVWLKMLEEKGLDPSIRTFADYWSRYACRYPWNEYGFFMRNFSRGLRPPVAGCFENYFVDDMGSPIRSEIWACLHPGDPQAAARMAWKDSSLDHTGGEGMNGEMFWAALQAAAFVESDPVTLIRIGLNVIPLSCSVARAIREVLWCHKNGMNWGQARQKIVNGFINQRSLHAVPNIAFTIIGWLYGEDFGDRLCKAVNCGYDTDCSGATLGALLGILDGSAGIPQQWIDPIGSDIVTHKFTGDCDAPTTIDELTDRTVALAETSLSEKDGMSFGDGDVFPRDLRTDLFRDQMALDARKQDSNSGVELLGDREVWLHYGGEPAVLPGIGKDVEVTVVPGPTPTVDMSVPDGWTCERLGSCRFRLLAPEVVAGQNTISVKLDEGDVDFVILGPAENTGFQAGRNVPECPKCHARVEACMCET